VTEGALPLSGQQRKKNVVDEQKAAGYHTRIRALTIA
jgi:hypothetical protein